tara:strand:+ start:33 stop:263 length:231 start_codon:yes stop_codon:yes gene_type:complete
MSMNKKEAVLLGYKVLYNRAGKLITERVSTDIKELKPYFTDEEYATLQTVMREGTVKLDEIHNHIEANLNARIMKE